MKKIIRKFSQAIQVVLMAPVKLPAKVLHVLRYVAVGLGIMEQVLEGDEEESEPPKEKGGAE